MHKRQSMHAFPIAFMPSFSSIAFAKAGFAAGTYTASSVGMMGDVMVEVVLSEDAIQSVTVTNQNETPTIAQTALDEIRRFCSAFQYSS